MECAVITTYRCNAKCGMCNTWKHPSKPAEEFLPEILEKIPGGMQRLNITGGEPTLRKDLIDIVCILDTKTNRLEISTNGSFPDRLVEVAGEFPNITIRVSIEGMPATNDKLRGIPEQVEDGVTGSLFEPFNHEVLAKKIKALKPGFTGRACCHGQEGQGKAGKDEQPASLLREYSSTIPGPYREAQPAKASQE